VPPVKKKFRAFGILVPVERSLAFLSAALSNTDARDSITEIFQYSARLVAGVCPSHELVSRRVYRSLSEGRKIYRLFKFIPEMNALMHIQDADTLIRSLSSFQSVTAIVFYVLDNWIYLLETVKRKSRGDIRPFKYVKNRVAFLRTLFSLIITLIHIHKLSRRAPKSDDPTDDAHVLKSRKALILIVRLWHESLRLWLTLHKLHLIELFVVSPSAPKYKPSDKHKFDVLPGAIGLASAITGFIRRTSLKLD
jgi:hypothetical protein